MLPMITQPAMAPACYVPSTRINQSQVFRGSQWLKYTPTVAQAAADRRRVTVNVWISPAVGAQQAILFTYRNSGATGVSFLQYRVTSEGYIHLSEGDQYSGTGRVWTIETSRVLRGPGMANLHFVMDSTLLTEANRAQLYINGRREAALSIATMPKVDYKSCIGDAVEHYLGRYYDSVSTGTTYAFNGLMAAPHIIVGQALPPTAFGEFNIHGVWVPKAYTGTYGIADSHLDFATPLLPGKDVSGQGNHWTAIGFDPAGTDTVASTPTNVYAALNPLDKSPYVAVGGGGLEFTGAASGTPGIAATLAFDIEGEAKEWEMTVGPSVNHWIGIIKDGTPGDQSYSSTSAISYQEDGRKHVLGVASAFAETYVAADKIRCRCGGGQIQFLKNGKVVGTAASGLTGRWRPYFYIGRSNYTAQVDFGQRGMVPGTGYTTLCTANLPEPAVKDPADALAQATTTGANMVAVLDAATAHWNGQWLEIVKRRETSEDWRVRFSDDPANAWAINSANAKTAAPALAAAGNYVGTRLRIGAKYGVWTAEVVHTNGTATTVPHGLGTVRNAVIATRVSAGGDRYLWHPDMTAGTLGKLNGAAVALAADGTLTAFGADSFQIASSAPSGTYRVLVLAERPGLLTLSTLTGNGVADGGFAAADVSPLLALMVPASAANRRLWDAARNPANPASISSALNLPDSESTAYAVDMVVGGVKARTTDAAVNGSGVKYHLLLWGRPVGGVCVAPATAR